MALPLQPLGAGNGHSSLQRAPSIAVTQGFRMKGRMTENKAQGREGCRGNEALPCRELPMWDLPSLFFINGKDESVDAYDRLKAQICQSEEIWFFSEKMRLIHRIQKDRASHRLVWEADLTLTQATEIFFFKFCEMQI